MDDVARPADQAFDQHERVDGPAHRVHRFGERRAVAIEHGQMRAEAHCAAGRHAGPGEGAGKLPLEAIERRQLFARSQHEGMAAAAQSIENDPERIRLDRPADPDHRVEQAGREARPIVQDGERDMEAVRPDAATDRARRGADAMNVSGGVRRRPEREEQAVKRSKKRHRATRAESKFMLCSESRRVERFPADCRFRSAVDLPMRNGIPRGTARERLRGG
jgi:hypothetical protein